MPEHSIQRVTAPLPNRYDQSTTYVPALRTPAALSTAPDVARNADTAILPYSAGLSVGHYTAAQVRQQDDAFIRARADLLVALGYVAAAGMTIAGLLILAALAGLFGWTLGQSVAAWIGGTGIAALVILYFNRRQSHHYSAAGIAHHELDARERIARHAVNVHAELLLRKWELDHGRDQ